ncbi:MAG: hypothetical protein NC418_07410 [Muribaculaceae bacterium]|nr:hypothetical protein [Muribaculaceae bacterium]
MKRFTIYLAAGILMCAAAIQACSHPDSKLPPLARAEQAYADSRYSQAQLLCDSLILSPQYSELSVDELCRLSLLFMRLGDSAGDIDANTAFAARTLKSAIERDADSTLLFLNTVPVEDQARVAILTAINEAHDAPAITDTITYDY